jgi:hypothetical protein
MMREYSGYFKSILFGIFLLALPLFYGSYQSIFRSEIIYCAALLFFSVIAGLGLSQKNANLADYANFRKYYIKVKFYFADNKQNKICENLRNLRNLRSKKLLRQPPAFYKIKITDLELHPIISTNFTFTRNEE